MTYIASVGVSELPYSMKQDDIKKLAKEIFLEKNPYFKRVLSVFDHANIHARQLSAPTSWYKEDHSFMKRNNLYQSLTLKHSLDAIDNCLQSKDFLHREVPYEAVDMIVFVSSTGISTPSMDAYILNERDFKPSIIRMPLWGLGCAGGAIGLSRAYEWIKLNKNKTALVICCELCSLTFQKEDLSISNFVGTALFGDGVAATLIVGEDSPYKNFCQDEKLSIQQTSSWTEKGTINMMGWELVQSGLKVIFNKKIPKLVRTLWKEHVENFLKENKLSIKDIATIVAHPGGRKVLEEMEGSFQSTSNLLRHSYRILSKHGNMSSATVLYVLLEKLLEGKINKGENELICALGPGFSSELLLAKWVSG